MKPLERTRRGQKDVEFKWKYRPLEGANDRSKVERRAKEREREKGRERERERERERRTTTTGILENQGADLALAQEVPRSAGEANTEKGREGERWTCARARISNGARSL